MEANTAVPSGTQTQTPPPPRYPPVIPGNQFVATKPTPPVPLILGIIDQGSKLAIGGGSKCYKTWILMDLAMSVATGHPWLGFQTFKNRVLYCNFEIPIYRFHERLELIASAKGVTVPAEFLVWNLRGYHIDEVTKLDIRDMALNQKAGLGLLDPLYKYGGGIDENSTAEIIKLFNSIDEITAKAGAAVCYGGHFSKGNQAAKNPIDRISGSGVHGRDPDAIINFTAHKEKDAFTVDITLRYLPPQTSFVVRWKCPLFEIDSSLDPKDLLRDAGRKRKATASDLFSILQQQRKIVDTDTFFALAKSTFKISRRTFDGIIPEVRLIPGVQQLTDGQWVYTR
jgi:AAA domain-containing protein